MIIATSLIYLSAIFTLHSGNTVANTIFDSRGNTTISINRSEQVDGNYYVIPDSFVNSAFTMAPSQFLTNADYPETLRFEATFILDDENGTWLSLTNFATIDFNITSSNFIGFQDYSVSGWVAENEINFQFNFHNYLRFASNNTNNHMALGYSPYICFGPRSFTGYNDIFWNFGNEQGGAVRNKLIIQWGMVSSDFYGTDNAYYNGYQEGYNTGYSDGEISGDVSGYTRGYNEALETFNETNEVFVSSVASILEIGLLPVNIFMTLLDIEVFGINVGAFVSSLITIVVITILLRTLLGGKGGKDE